MTGQARLGSMSFVELAETILARPCAESVRLVAVDGGAGAGKTTFAELLAAALRSAVVVPMDDFISVEDLTGWWARLEEQVLAPLFAGKACRYQRRDWVGDLHGSGLGEWRDVARSETVIFEGVGSSRRQLGSRLHYAVWIDAPPALRMQRGIERDAEVVGNREIWDRWLSFEAAFLTADGARDRADMVVDGTTPYAGLEQAFVVLEQR